MTNLPLSPLMAAAVDRMHDAALGAQTWPLALDGLAAAAGAAGCILIPRDPALMELGFPTSTIMIEPIAAFVAEGWYRADPRADRWPTTSTASRVVIEHEITTERERASLPYYESFLGGFGLPWWAAIGFEVDGNYWGLSLLRGDGQGPYLREHVRELARLAPHMRRAVKLAMTLQNQVAEQTIQALGAVGAATIMLDRLGRVAAINPPAEALLCDELTVRFGHLAARNPHIDREVQMLLQAAISSVSPSGQSDPCLAVVERRGKMPIIIEAYAMPALARNVFSGVAAILILRDTDIDRTISKPILMRIFGLTSAEANIAIGLASGSDLRTVASNLNISYQTARVHLKMIFGKTNLSRQADLVRIVGKIMV